MLFFVIVDCLGMLFVCFFKEWLVVIVLIKGMIKFKLVFNVVLYLLKCLIINVWFWGMNLIDDLRLIIINISKIIWYENM